MCVLLAHFQRKLRWLNPLIIAAHLMFHPWDCATITCLIQYDQHWFFGTCLDLPCPSALFEDATVGPVKLAKPTKPSMLFSPFSSVTRLCPTLIVCKPFWTDLFCQDSMSLRSLECLEFKNARPQALEVLAFFSFCWGPLQPAFWWMHWLRIKHDIFSNRCKGKWSNVLFRAFIGGKGFEGIPCPAKNIASDHPCWGTVDCKALLRKRPIPWPCLILCIWKGLAYAMEWLKRQASVRFWQQCWEQCLDRRPIVKLGILVSTGSATLCELGHSWPIAYRWLAGNSNPFCL